MVCSDNVVLVQVITNVLYYIAQMSDIVNIYNDITIYSLKNLTVSADTLDTLWIRPCSPAKVAESFIDNNRETSQSSQDSDSASEIAKRKQA